jgi:hypothetical protein
VYESDDKLKWIIEI